MPRPLSESARQKAIDATLALVAEGGIDGFTMDGVAKRSGVAKTTLYRHWDSSNELLVTALDCKVEHIPGPDTGTLRGDLSALMSMMANIAGQPGNRELILEVLGLAARDPEFLAVNEAMMAERTRPISRHDVIGRVTTSSVRSPRTGPRRAGSPRRQPYRRVLRQSL